MKTLILSTVAAAVIALSASTAFASSNSPDQGFDIMLQSLNQSHNAPASERQFLSGHRAYGQRAYDQRVYDQGVSDNGKDAAEFRAVQNWGR